MASDMSFEWGFRDNDNPYVTTAMPPEKGRRGGRVGVEEVEMPNYFDKAPGRNPALHRRRQL